jgi:hypothetical protein
MSSYAEEQAARLQAEGDKPFRATHRYNPNMHDEYDPRGVQGEPIRPMSDVELLREHNKGLHQGMPGAAKKMFNVVRDAQGNRQHVAMASLEHIWNDRRKKK